MDLFNLLLFKLSGGKIEANSLYERIIYKAMAGGGLPSGYKELAEIDFDGTFYYITSQHLTGDDDVTMTLSGTSTTGQNVFGCYEGGSADNNFSLYIYGGGSTSFSYFRYGGQLVRPNFGSGKRTITFGKSGTKGFNTNVSVTPAQFTCDSYVYIGMLPNSTSPKFTGKIIGHILVGNRIVFIPCQRESDNVIGYYDTNKKEFIEPTAA